MSLAVLLLACNGPTDDTPTGETGTEASPFQVLADQIPGGTLLSAWSDGNVLRFVGGGLELDGSGTGNLVTYDGTTVCVEENAAPKALWWIHGPRAGEWYAVGAGGTILHEVDGVRTDESVATAATLFGVWANADGSVWAVGGDVRNTNLGEVWRRDVGGGWTLFQGDIDGVLFKVWDRWFVGDRVAFHLENDVLVDRTPEAPTKLLTLRGRADDDVWAVGGLSSPEMMHWDGTAWSDVSIDLTCTSQPLNGVWTAPGEDVWFAGNTGAMGSLDGSTWDCARPPISYEHFHAVWPHEGAFYWAGGNLFSPGDNYGTIGVYSDTPVSPLTAQACAR